MATDGARAFPVRALGKAAAAITLAFAAFTILVHVPAGRRLLAPIFGDKCPYVSSAADVEAARVGAVRATAGDAPAPSRPALGFELDRSKPADVKAWAARVGVSCAEKRDGALLDCADVPASAVPPSLPGPNLSQIVFAFEPKGMTLVNISAYLTNVSEDVAAARLSGVRDHLRAVLGPAKELGAFDAAYLRGAERPTTTVTYRFRDYQADLSAIRLRPGEVLVREHYVAGAPPAAPAAAPPSPPASAPKTE
jgi:hypothetical protein